MGKRERGSGEDISDTWRLSILWQSLPRRLADLISSRRFRVQGPSMEPGLRDGDLVLVSRAAYLRAAPARGDVVLVRVPGLGVEAVKRVVALPDEEIHLLGGRASVDGVALAEPYLAPLSPKASTRDGSWRLGEGEYFLLGDNRSDSLDSRAFGPVPKQWLLGCVRHIARQRAVPARPTAKNE